MALSDREKKRRSRARKPKKYHDREREENRKRMAIMRAKVRAQKRASQLKTLLNEEEKQEIEARAAELKQRLVCDWFRHKKLRFNPTVVQDDNILNSFMTKLDLHTMERQVAEFEASIMEGKLADDGDDKNIALGLGGEGGKFSHKFNSREQDVGVTNNEIDRLLEKDAATSDIAGKYGQKILGMDSQDSTEQTFYGMTSMKHKIESREQDVGVTNNEIDRLLEKDAATSDIAGKYGQKILGMDCQDSTEQTFYGMTSIKVAERWEDEVLAAEAMAIMNYGEK